MCISVLIVCLLLIAEAKIFHCNFSYCSTVLLGCHLQTKPVMANSQSTGAKTVSDVSVGVSFGVSVGVSDVSGVFEVT